MCCNVLMWKVVLSNPMLESTQRMTKLCVRCNVLSMLKVLPVFQYLDINSH